MTSPTSTETLITSAYKAFNRRDIDAALALMSENVTWPRASEGGNVVGKAEIRAYWTRQWSEFDPTVQPLELIVNAHGKTEVRVHQLVRSLSGEVLFDGEVRHVYTLSHGLIDSMELGDSGAGEASSPSAAFAKH